MAAFWIMIFGIVYFASEELSLVVGYAHVVTSVIIGIYIAVLYFFINRHDKLLDYGIIIPQNLKKRDLLYSVPLFGYVCVNLVLQINKPLHSSSWSIFIIILYSVFLEEFLFRGYLFWIIQNKYHINNEWIVILLTSGLFALFHLVNIIQGAEVSYTIIQMLCAFSIGICFGVMKTRTKSIFPGMVLHFLINLSSYGIEIYNKMVLCGWLIVAVLLFFYGYYLYNKMKKKEKRL